MAEALERDTMTPDPLLTEWLATPDLNSLQHKDLTALGVTQEAIHRCGGLAWARVSTVGRLYAPRGAGNVSLIQPVWAGPAPSIHQGVEHPELADLIAWPLAEPGRWFYRNGTPGAALGQEHLDAVLLEQAEGFWEAQRTTDQATMTAEWWSEDAA